MIRIKYIFLLILSNYFIVSYSQKEADLSPAAIKAITYYNSADYNKAAVEFKKLHIKFPKDPLYEYYLGACMLETNTEINTALELLKSASFKNVPSKVYYYLSIGYYRQFMFNKARQELDNYKNAKGLSREINVSAEQERIKYASTFFAKQQPVIVLSSEVVKRKDLNSYLSKIEGLTLVKLNSIVDPTYVNIETDNELIVQTNATTDVVFFVSSKEGQGLKKGDIYKIVSKPDEKNYQIENAGSRINTYNDESQPFYDNNSATLYFSTKGRKSVGGYDIYKLKLDEKHQPTTEPEQLPFPFNSQYNDYIIGSSSDFLIIGSDRSCNYDEIQLYYIKNEPFNDPENSDTQAEQLKALFFNESYKKKSSPPSFKKEVALQPKIESNNMQAKTLPNIDANYLINSGLLYQKKADSLLYKQTTTKGKLSGLTEAKERNAIFAEMSRLDKQSTLYQNKADSVFKKTTKKSPRATNAIVQQVDTCVPKIKTERIFQFQATGTSPYSAANPYSIDQPIPLGLIYRIQLGAFSKTLSYSYFGALQPIFGESIPEAKVVKYYVGTFNVFSNADEALTKVQANGFKDSFVVAFYNGKKIPLERAKEFEKRR